MDCFTLAFGRIIEYKFPTGLAEITATLAPLCDKGSLARHFFRVLFFSFFNPSLHHYLPLLEERYCLSPYRNYLKNVEEGKRKKKNNLHRYHSMALQVVNTLSRCLCWRCHYISWSSFQKMQAGVFWELLLWLHLPHCWRYQHTKVTWSHIQCRHSYLS